MLLWCLLGAVLCWILTSGVGLYFRYKLIGKRSDVKRLEAENAKLVTALLEPPKSRKKTEVEKLIDAIHSDMHITGVYSELHDDKGINDRFNGLRPLVTYEFNDGLVKLRELVDYPDEWKIDLLYKNTLVAGLQQEHRDHLRDMLADKIAEAVLGDLEK